MKKLTLLTIFIIFIFIITGCGRKTIMKCTAVTKEFDAISNTEVIAEFDRDDKLSDATITYEFEDEKTVNIICDFFKEDFYQEVMEEHNIKTSCKGKQVEVKHFINYYENEEDNLIGKTKKEFKDYMEAENYACK